MNLILTTENTENAQRTQRKIGKLTKPLRSPMFGSEMAPRLRKNTPPLNLATVWTQVRHSCKSMPRRGNPFVEINKKRIFAPLGATQFTNRRSKWGKRIDFIEIPQLGKSLCLFSASSVFCGKTFCNFVI